ncbi:hypothetical protein J6590_026858 [Homalodisca vitripennis]|nr:hypothetical protein J6590_101487 [Homalodisca vitripennis]KAG8302658.1 hypothetical protein J6590_026858 [Homalodisca vitripennis]
MLLFSLMLLLLYPGMRLLSPTMPRGKNLHTIGLLTNASGIIRNSRSETPRLDFIIVLCLSNIHGVTVDQSAARDYAAELRATPREATRRSTGSRLHLWVRLMYRMCLRG